MLPTSRAPSKAQLRASSAVLSALDAPRSCSGFIYDARNQDLDWDFRYSILVTS